MAKLDLNEKAGVVSTSLYGVNMAVSEIMGTNLLVDFAGSGDFYTLLTGAAFGVATYTGIKVSGMLDLVDDVTSD